MKDLKMFKLKRFIYSLLVNRIPGIQIRYTEKRAQSRFFALILLMRLNFQYYFLFQKKLFDPPIKKLRYKNPESCKLLPPELFAEKLSEYDIISFDVFDTLVFRPFSSPADLFYLTGIKLGYINFKPLRTESERQARELKFKSKSTREATLEEIWEIMEQKTGIKKSDGISAELECEKSCCFANPYMLRVACDLQKRGKTIIAVSDMYLPSAFIKKLLKNCGYPDFHDYFISCEHNKSKSGGALFKAVKNKFNSPIVHIGDSRISDKLMAERENITAFLYKNVNALGKKYRTEDISPFLGSIYRGIVNARIYNGLNAYSREYEYGFIYGGLFAVGYCRFIHEYFKSCGCDKLLFLSRDGSLLIKIYNLMYPNDKTEYVYWSRMSAVKIAADHFRNEFFEKFISDKINQSCSVKQAIEQAELSDMLYPLCSQLCITPGSELNTENAQNIKKYLTQRWDAVLSHYSEQIKAGKIYWQKILKGCSNAAAVDIGWAGSGICMLDFAVNKIWDLNCNIKGILAGATAENQLQFPAFMFSAQKNRDIWRLHRPEKNHNLYWELLLSSPDGSLKGFYLKNNECTAEFKKCHTDAKKINEIHKGALDFAEIFLQTEKRLGIKIAISGRDAYAPMAAVCSDKNKKFIRGLKELLDEANVG